MFVKGKRFHLISNGEGAHVGAVATETDKDGNLIVYRFDPISIVDTHKVFDAINTGQPTPNEAPPHGPRPPGDNPEV